MDYFTPGFRELRRIAERSTHRVRLALARRRLAAAETELGQLGWQQADFDEQTERRVDEIQHVEREQARLHNASAELARKIQALTAERTRLRQEHDAQRAPHETERDRLRGLIAEVEARLAGLRKADAGQKRRVETAGEDQRRLEREHNDLLEIQPQTPQIRGDLINLHKRQDALQEELVELDRQRVLIAEEIVKDETELANLGQQRTAPDTQLRALASAAEEAEAKLAGELREAEKEKARIAAASDKLEAAKLDPYREIGRVLADSGVAPANQPGALVRVRHLRRSIEGHTAAIAASNALTAQENYTQLRISQALLALIAIALALLVGALF